MAAIWTYKGRIYRLVKTGTGYDIFQADGGWIAWTAGSVKDAKDTVRSMAS